MSIHIALPEEAERLAAFASEIWIEHYTPMIGRPQVDYMLEKYQSSAQIIKDMENGYRYWITRDEQNGWTGYCSVRLDQDSLFISKIYVIAERRGQNIGREMLEEMLRFAQEQNKSNVWLTVNKNNKDSLAAYQAWGFTIAASVLTDIGGGYYMDDYVMEKLLPNP